MSKNNIKESTNSYIRISDNVNGKSIIRKKETWIAYLLWIVPVSNGLGAFWFYVHANVKGTISIILTVLTILFGSLTWTSLKWERFSNMFVGDENNTQSIITTSTVILFIFQIVFIIIGIAWWIFSGIVLQDKVNRYNCEQEK